jgi:ketosteroid isomerase-like protein
MGHFDINSRQALMDTIKKFWSPVAKFGRGQLDVQIHVLAADLALVKDVATSSVFFKDGRTWEGKHHNTHLFRKEADGWKMIFWSQVQDIKQI